MTLLAILVLLALLIGLAYIQGVRYRNLRFALRRQDDRLEDLRRSLDQATKDLASLKTAHSEDAAHVRFGVGDIHRRLKRTEIALGIDEGRRSVRAENARKTRLPGAGSPLPATFAPRPPRTTKK